MNHGSKALWALIGLLGPTPSLAQVNAGITLVEVRPRTLTEVCSVRDEARSRAWFELLDARALDDEEAELVLASLEDSLRTEVAAHPSGVERQYALALTLGLRADREGGRSRVGIAKETFQRTQAVLAMQPSHPGAQHLLGRLHAAVLRMDRVTRFVATRLLGGGELAGASWEEARWRLEAAVAGDPCVPDHHYELARLYAERDEPELALDELRTLERLPRSHPSFESVFELGRALRLQLEEEAEERREP